MKSPTATFIVPCFKLAHLLPECVTSILTQTLGDLEVIIMDDRSPDNTPDVARSFGDERVRHVRNEVNLGHLRNYNKGIELARGRYIWLISADDYLRTPHALKRYVDVLDRTPNAGFAFSAGVGVRDGVETGPIEYASWGPTDRVVERRTLLTRLLERNYILAASGMVRREFYERYGVFPLDMPWAGDWYMWCLFALFGSAAYFAEPLVCYRQHGLSMTTHLTGEKARECRDEELMLRWRLFRKAITNSPRSAAAECERAIAFAYALSMTVGSGQETLGLMRPEDFELSLSRYASGAVEHRRIRALVYSLAASYHRTRDRLLAKSYCDLALQANPWLLRAWAVRLLIYAGDVGKNR